MQTETQSPKAGERTQHTPGPWHYCERRGQFEILDMQGGGECEDNALIATVYGTFQNEANARLIAAAPDLLSALRLAHHNLPSILSYTGSEVEAEVLNAIAKAEGTNP